jgi:hypothetical protein
MKRRLLALLLAAVLLALPVLADTPDTEENDLETLLAAFRADWGLTEDNFAMAYVDLDTGEYSTFQYDQWMVAGSTFKVPLAMLYYDRIRDGSMTESTTVGGLRLDSALERIIVNSDNDAAKTLMYAIGNNVWSQYRQLLTQYSGQDYPDKFFSTNVMNCHYMVDCLLYLYDHADDYPTLLEHMAEAMPGMYFQKYVTDYTVCHKYGLYEGAVNDIAIVYGPHTYIVTAFSQNVYDAETMLGELNQLLVQRLERLTAEEAEEDAAEISGTEDTVEPVEETVDPSPAAITVETVADTESTAPATVESAAETTVGWSVMGILLPLAAAACMAVLVAVVWLLWRRHSRRKVRK